MRMGMGGGGGGNIGWCVMTWMTWLSRIGYAWELTVSLLSGNNVKRVEYTAFIGLLLTLSCRARERVSGRQVTPPVSMDSLHLHSKKDGTWRRLRWWVELMGTLSSQPRSIVGQRRGCVDTKSYPSRFGSEK